MPGVVDDIIIKFHILDGYRYAMTHLGDQVEKYGLIADCQDVDGELRAAFIDFRRVLDHVIEEMENRVTAKAIQPPTP